MLIPNSSFVSYPYFQELIERDNLEEMSVATNDLGNGLTLEERFALSQRTLFKTHQVVLRWIQEQRVVSSEERSALRQENADLRQDNAELRQANVEIDNRLSNLQNDVYIPIRAAIISRIDVIRKSFFTNINRMIEDRGKRQQVRFIAEVLLAFRNPVPDLDFEVGNNEVTINTLKQLNEIKRDVSEKPLLVRDLEFKRNYESSIIALENAAASFERQMMKLPRYSPLKHSVTAEYRFSQI